MVCIYHNKDLDGFTSGAIVKKWHSINQDDELIMIGYDYNQPIPYDIIPKGERLIMVDVSLPMPEMLKLSEHVGSFEDFVWIDHHASAISDYESFMTDREEHKEFLTAVLVQGIAACEITWKYLFGEEPLPMAVLLLGEYDTWRNTDATRWDKFIMPFQFGMRSICNSPESFPISLIDRRTDKSHNESSIKDIIVMGFHILNYRNKLNEGICSRASFEHDINGYRAICLNASDYNSSTFDSVYNEEIHDIMVPFQYDGEYWSFSIYTTKNEIDCSKLAKIYGGGGHKMAAGFKVKDITTIFPRILNV